MSDRSEWRVLFVVLVACLVFSPIACRSGKGPRSYTSSRAQAGATFASFQSKRVVQAAMHYPDKDRDPVAQVPMSLTGSDGTGLQLVSLNGKAVIKGPLAFTELHLTFRNTQNRVREGRFSIRLPDGAAVSRFAMKLPSGWQEAEIVERQQARRIYEDFLHRKQDPALLEKKAGNAFRARIFPIPAGGLKEITIAYSQNLERKEQPYRMRLKGLPTIGTLELTAYVGLRRRQDPQASSLGGVRLTQKVVRVARTDYAPDEDFVVRSESEPAGLRNGNLALMRLKPKLSSGRAKMASLLLLVDTSASRAAGFWGQVEKLGELLAQLKKTYGGDLPIHLACFDQQVGSIFVGNIGELQHRHLDAILARRALGASDLDGALAWAAKQPSGFQRVVLVTDGVATAGQLDTAALRGRVKALGEKGTKRLDVVLVGGIRDVAAMKRLARSVLERDGIVADGEADAEALARRLSRDTISGIEVSVAGARWIWPRRLDGVQPGDEVLIFADLPQGALKAGAPLVASLAGGGIEAQSHRASLVHVERPLLERAWVEARIAHLQDQLGGMSVDPDMKGAIKKQIIELSTKHRVLSDYTALLVLETEADYARYGIKRSALADILVVGAGGVQVEHRTTTPVARPNTRRPRSVDDRSKRDRGQGQQSPPPPARPSAEQLAAPAKARAKRSMAPPAPKVSTDDSLRRLPRSGESDDEAPRSLSRIASEPRPTESPKNDGPPALSGKLAEIVATIKAGEVEQALVDALRWRAEKPGDVMALIALGRALEASGRAPLAARVYGSIIDLFPSRADMRRFAGAHLEALRKAGLPLALDSYRKAVAQRPDHASGHRLLAFALLRAGKTEAALRALERGLAQRYRIQRPGVLRILRDDLGLVAAAHLKGSPKGRPQIEARLRKHGAAVAEKPSLRFVLNWETDANDVDFHIHDSEGGHAYYSNKALPSGGALYADVTNGFGPECFTITGQPKAYPYKLQIHYYSRGPMGYGTGKLQIIQHDGAGTLRFEDRPFVVMNDSAYVDLGVIKGPLL